MLILHMHDCRGRNTAATIISFGRLHWQFIVIERVTSHICKGDPGGLKLRGHLTETRGNVRFAAIFFDGIERQRPTHYILSGGMLKQPERFLCFI